MALDIGDLEAVVNILELRATDWRGFNNARDIGRMLLRSGGVTVRGAVIRSDTPAVSDSQGGVSMQTLAREIDLRSVEEADALAHPMPPTRTR